MSHYYTDADLAHGTPCIWNATKRERVAVPLAVYKTALVERNHLVSQYERFPRFMEMRLYNREWGQWLGTIEDALDPESPTFVADAHVRKTLVVGTLTRMQRIENAITCDLCAAWPRWDDPL